MKHTCWPGQLRKRALHALLLLAATASVALPLASSAPHPKPSLVRSIVIDRGSSNTIYAGCDTGLFLSTDSGKTWAVSLNGSQVWAICLGASASPTVYAATGRGVVLSRDGGRTWSEWVVPGAGGVASLTRRNAPTEVVYAGTFDGRVFRTTDGGGEWKALRKPVDRSAILAIAARNNSDSFLLAGTAENGMFVTENDGLSWAAVGKPQGSIDGVVMSEGPIRRFFAATGVGLFRSDDGKSWTQVTAGLPANAPAMAVATKGTQGRIYVSFWGHGIYRSTDNGERWVAVGSYPNIRALTVDPFDEKTVYAGGLTGILTSGDMGSTWRGLP